MDRKKYYEWYKTHELSDKLAEKLMSAINSLSGTDRNTIFSIIEDENPSVSTVLMALRRSGVDVAEISQAIRASRQPVQASIPVSGSPASIPARQVKTEQPSKASWLKGVLKKPVVPKESSAHKPKPPFASLNVDRKTIMIAGGVVLGVFVFAFVLFLALQGNVAPKSENQGFVPNFAEETVPPVQAFQPDQGAVQVPQEATQNAQQSRSWFMPEGQEVEDKGGLTMAPPKSLLDIFRNPDWSFLIFVITLLLMIGLAKQERFNEQDQTDWRVIKIGYALFFVGLILSPMVGDILTRAVFFLTETSFAFDPVWVQIVFSASALIAFVMAAITGKVDWTPVSVGLFTMGGFLVAFNPSGPGRIIGYICMVVGVVVHIGELAGEQGTAGALGLVVVGLPLFIAFRYGFAALLGLIANVAPPVQNNVMFEVIKWACFIFYNYRILWATVVALLIAYALATGVAAAIFPPIARMLPQSGQLVGNLVPTEDTPRIDAVVMFLMAVASYWMIVGHF